MSEEISKLTKEDLVLWLDRPPSNDDLDLCEFLANAVQNRQKYYEENQQLKEQIEQKYEKLGTLYEENTKLLSVLNEIREKLDFAKATIEHDKDYDIGYNFLINANKIVEILDKVNSEHNSENV